MELISAPEVVIVRSCESIFSSLFASTFSRHEFSVLEGYLCVNIIDSQAILSLEFTGSLSKSFKYSALFVAMSPRYKLSLLYIRHEL